MKILVKETEFNTDDFGFFTNIKGTKFVWKKVKPNNGYDINLRGRYETVDGKFYYEWQVYGMKDSYLNSNPDNGKHYVFCESCHKIVIDDEEHRAKHMEEQKLQADCLKCSKLRERDAVVTKYSKYKLLSDGTYERTETKKTKLYCDTRYSLTTFDDAKQGGYCPYYKCEKANTFIPMRRKTLFEDYPDFFGEMLTEKKLFENGWSVEQNNETGRVWKYKKYCIRAIADVDGIVTKFTYGNGSNPVEFVYSSIYRMYAGKSMNTWSTPMQSFVWSNTTTMDSRISKIIEALYK